MEEEEEGLEEEEGEGRGLGGGEKRIAPSSPQIPTEPPSGLLGQVPNLHESHCVLLLPCDEELPDLDYKEIYQIVREMTVAIYACNQIPGESPFDRAGKTFKKGTFKRGGKTETAQRTTNEQQFS